MSNTQNANGGASTLPVLETTKAALTKVLENWSAIGRLMLPMLVVAYAELRVVSSWPHLIVQIVFIGLSLWATVMLVTGVLRIAGGDDPAAIRTIRWTRVETTIAAYVLVIGLILVSPYFLPFIAIYFGSEQFLATYIWLSLAQIPLIAAICLWIALAILIQARWSMVYPAIVRRDPASLRLSWRLTAGNTIRLFGIYGLILLIGQAVSRIVEYLPVILPFSGHFTISVYFVVVVIQIAINLFFVATVVAAASIVYDLLRRGTTSEDDLGDTSLPC